MGDQTTTSDQAEQANQASAAGTAGSNLSATQVPAGYVEKGRLDGALQKIQELTLANRALQDQLAAKDTAFGQLQAQLTEKETLAQAQVGEKAKEVETLQARMNELSKTSAEYAALQRKLNAIKTLGRPELISIMDVLPTADTDEAQVEAMKTIAAFAAKQSQARESELLAGLTKTEVPPTHKQQDTLPTDAQDWNAYIEKFPLGSAERQAAMEGWFATFNPK